MRCDAASKRDSPLAAFFQVRTDDSDDDDELEIDECAVEHTGPSLASHERKRAMRQNPPPKGQRSTKRSGERKTPEPKKETAKARIARHPKEELQLIRGDTIFCRACKQEISAKHANFHSHLSSQKHKNRVEEIRKRTGEDTRINTFIADYYAANPNEAGSATPAEVLLFRWTVVESFLQSGIPLTKVDELRTLLELTGQPLTHRSHLRSFIPKILSKEMDLIKEEINGQYLSISFDGTTRLGEAVNLCARFVPSGFSCIGKRVLALITTATHMNGVSLYRLISKIILSDLNIDADRIVGISRDSCSTNGVACKHLLTMFANSLDLLCCSHTLQHTGEHLQLKTVEEFLHPWLTLVSHTSAARTIWQSMMGISMKGYSKIRWWSRWEVMKDLAEHFGQLYPFCWWAPDPPR